MMYEYEPCWSKNNDRAYEYANTSSTQQVGMTYVPMQRWSNLLPLEEGFYQGTIFQDLDKPFLGGNTR